MSPEQPSTVIHVTHPDIQSLRTEMREGRERMREDMKEGFRGVHTRLDTQNGRVGKLEDKVLILEHDAEIEAKSLEDRKLDDRQKKLVQDIAEVFKTYISPALTTGGVLYFIAKGLHWVP